MKSMISPSLMCADVLNLQSEITLLDNLGVEYIHLDFMDGKFVPNITLDTTLIKKVKTVLCNMNRDIHIMAFEPEQYFDKMNIGNGDIVAVHYESCKDIVATLNTIKSTGAKPFVAISPDTSEDVLLPLLDIIDGVLVMTVYPGFAGQPIVEGSLEKISRVKSIIDNCKKDIILEVDGHVSWDMCPKMRKAGADLFVAGSSSIYSDKMSVQDAVVKMRELIV